MAERLLASKARLALAVAAVAAGAAAGWLAAGGLSALAGATALVAFMNGYSKAYSP